MVPCLYRNPNPDKIWSNSIFRGLSFYRINSKMMPTEIKMVVVVVDKVPFDKVSRTAVSLSFTKPVM